MARSTLTFGYRAGDEVILGATLIMDLAVQATVADVDTALELAPSDEVELRVAVKDTTAAVITKSIGDGVEVVGYGGGGATAQIRVTILPADWAGLQAGDYDLQLWVITAAGAKLARKGSMRVMAAIT